MSEKKEKHHSKRKSKSGSKAIQTEEAAGGGGGGDSKRERKKSHRHEKHDTPYDHAEDESKWVQDWEDDRSATEATHAKYPADAGPFWAVERDAESTIRPADRGVASSAPTTVPTVFRTAAARGKDRVALRVEREGSWIEWSWAKYYEEARRAGRAFMHLGLKQHDAVNIIGFNSPEWFISAVGCILAGGITAGIYTTNQTEACRYISDHSGARVIVVENDKQLEKFLPIRDELKELVALVQYTGSVADDVNKEGSPKVYDWAQFMALGDEVKDTELDARCRAQKPGHTCSLIYTSGTTGNPKAVKVTHDNLTWTPKVVFAMLPGEFGSAEEHAISYLPLSHVAAAMLGIFLPMTVVAVRGGNYTIHFARPDALKGSLGDTLRAVRPTVFFGVPRVWEKMAEKMKAIGAQTGGLKKKIGAFAKGRLLYSYEQDQAGGSGKKKFMTGTAEKILSKVHVALGLDRAKICLTAAAPISAETLRYFGSLGIRVYELYGMSESSGPQTSCCPPREYKIGTVGHALPGCQLKLEHEEGRDRENEGEICFRGRHIFQGYLNNPEKTAEAIDDEGWLHSGDVGRMDEDGYLSITGRIKELIITAGGENIAPVPMEDAIKDFRPGVKDVAMQGDKRKFNVCLIALHCKENDDGTFTNELVEPSLSISSAKTVEEAREDKTWQAYLQEGLDHANKTAAVSNASKIQKFAIIDRPFSVPAGELTPTLKLKRSVIREKYKDVIDAMYPSDDPPAGEKKAKRKSTGGKKK